jgi:hypothetical protein
MIIVPTISSAQEVILPNNQLPFNREKDSVRVIMETFFARPFRRFQYGIFILSAK